MRRLVKTLARRLGGGERAFFDDDYYRASYRDIAETGVDPFTHFMAHGWREGRNPSARFATLFYRDHHLDGAATNPLSHYVAAGARASGLATAPPSPAAALDVQRALVREGFDAAYYALQGAVADPLTHYLTAGWRQGRSPTPSFDPSRYNRENAYVEALDVAPYYHWASQRRMRSGAVRPARPAAVPRREIKRVIAPAFDAAAYLDRYADVRASGRDPLDHYVDHGWRERRDPAPLFDSAYYLAANADVAASGINPFYHYLTAGRAAGRRPNPVGSGLYPAHPAPDAAAWDAC